MTRPRPHLWTADEDATLIRLRVSTQLTWQQISEQMGLRHWQCMQRWMTLKEQGRLPAVVPARIGGPYAVVADVPIPVTHEEPLEEWRQVVRASDVTEPAVTAEPVRPRLDSIPPPPERHVADIRRDHGQRTRLAELAEANRKLLDELEERDSQLATLQTLRDAPPPIVDRTPRQPGHKRHGVPVLMCSDWHVEEPVRPESVNGLNEYNLEIAAGCIDRMAEAFVWFLLDSRYDCREGVVWLGGDLYSGYIHAELQESNLLSPVESSLWLQGRIELMLLRILQETQLERIVVVCNDGNHGRLTQKMRVSTRTENSLEWLLFHTLAARFANEPRLQFQIADGVRNYLDIYDTTICFAHGDTFKYGGGVGGLLIPVRRGFNEWRKYKKVDHLVIGHFHQRLDAGDVIVNGSMIGVNAYSMSISAPPERRQQSWFLIDSVEGKALSAPVWL